MIVQTLLSVGARGAPRHLSCSRRIYRNSSSPSYFLVLRLASSSTGNKGIIAVPLANDSESHVTKSRPTVEISETIRRIVSESRPEMKLVGLSAATLGITSSVTLLLPHLSGKVIDAAVLAAADPVGAEFSAAPVAMGLFGLTALAGGGVFVRSLLLTKAGNRIVSRLRRRLFASALAQDAAYFDATPTGDVLSRLSADCQLVQAAVTTQAVSVLRAIFMSVGAAAMLFQTSGTLALVSLGTLPPVLVAARHFGRALRDRQARVQSLHAEATSAAEETISGIRTVKQFGAERHEIRRYSVTADAAHEEAIRAGGLQAAFDGGVHVAANGAVLCVLGYGGTLVLAGELTAGDLAGFLMYSLLMSGNISSLSSTYADMMKSVAAAGRIFEIVDRTPNIPATFDSLAETSLFETDPGGRQITANKGENLLSHQLSVEFRNIRFAYPARPDVDVIGPGFSLKINPGEILAVVGGSGSGKSTLAALLTRLYDISLPCKEDADCDSAVLIDGVDVRDIDPAVLRECIGIVSQEPQLFSTTIEENIRYGKLSASNDEVREAARIAHVLNFADGLPDGLQTFVGSRGTRSAGVRNNVLLSPGQY